MSQSLRTKHCGITRVLLKVTFVEKSSQLNCVHSIQKREYDVTMDFTGKTTVTSTSSLSPTPPQIKLAKICYKYWKVLAW